HNACVAPQVPDGKRKVGSGTQLRKEVNLNAIRGKHVGYQPGERWGVITAIKRDGYFYGLLRACLQQVIAEALCSSPNGVFIHPVGAYAHDAAEAAGTKLQVLVKAIGKFSKLLAVKQFLHGASRSVVIRCAQPNVGTLLDRRI